MMMVMVMMIRMDWSEKRAKKVMEQEQNVCDAHHSCDLWRDSA